ncbi:glycosyltransferase [Parafrigoribacterium mesophilum]
MAQQAESRSAQSRSTQSRSTQSTAFADLLLQSGLITTAQLAIARAGKARTGSHIDEVLTELGLVDSAALRRVMSDAWSLPQVDLASGSVDEDLVRKYSGQRLMAENWIPVRALQDSSVLVATARVPDAGRAAYIAAVVHAPVTFAVATSWDIRHAVLRIYNLAIAEQAANELWDHTPQLSAKMVLSRGQKAGTLLALLAAAALAVVWPLLVVLCLVTLLSFGFLAGISFRFIVALRGAKVDIVERVSDREVAELDDGDLPVYTVLVPVFHEENIIPRLVENLGKIDYPQHKLEILILIEEDDLATRAAVEGTQPPANFRIVTVPRGEPQTKPRACNVGLFVASGEFLVIFDAEDTPDPDQLKRALIAFRHGGSKTVCVQAALNYFNARENILTRMFTLEYSYWYDYMLPGLDLDKLPIPLGGTSNHFRTSALIELGGWDPFNVTEDADLGIRASALGFRVGVVNSTTMEEANTSVPNFIRQRSRWVKGYLQTALVHARSPRRLVRQIGLRRVLGFALLIAGTPASFLGVLPFYALAALTVLVPAAVLSEFVPVWLLWVCMVNFLTGTAVMVYLSMMGPYKRGTFTLIPWAFLNPVYWILHSFAAYKALWQLVSKPHYWEKTQHGLTHVRN